MKKLKVFIIYFFICKLTLANRIPKKDLLNDVTFIFKFTPSNLFNLNFSVIQFGNEFRYKSYGLSSEYGYQSRLFQDQTYQKENYFTLRSEIRKYYRLDDKYLAIEYFYLEHYYSLNDYNYWTDHGNGEYYYTNVDHISIGKKRRGFNFKVGQTLSFKLFELDYYLGLGVRKTRTRIVYRSTPKEDFHNMHRGIIKPNTGIQESDKFSPQICLGVKIAIPLFSFPNRK